MLTDNERMHQKVSMDLAVCIASHPTAQILTDVGASMFSGYGRLSKFSYDRQQDTIVLEFGSDYRDGD